MHSAATSACRRALGAWSSEPKRSLTPPVAPAAASAAGRPSGSRARITSRSASEVQAKSAAPRRRRRRSATSSPPAQTATVYVPSAGQRSAAASAAVALAGERGRSSDRVRCGARRAPTGCRPPPRAAGERGALVGGERPVADDHPHEPEQHVAVAQRQAPAPGHPERLVLRHVDELARPLQAKALEPRGHVRRRFAGQDRPLADRVRLVRLRAVRQQPPAAVLDRDRPADLGLEVVDDLLQVGHARQNCRVRSDDRGESGAGICGLATAFELERRGHRALVLEAEGVGAGQSAGLARIFRIAHRDAAVVCAGAGGAGAVARVGARARARTCSATKGWWSSAARSRPRRCARSARPVGVADARPRSRRGCRRCGPVTRGATGSGTRWPARRA